MKEAIFKKAGPMASAAALMLFSGCTQEHPHPHPHPHDAEEPKSLAVTVWGERHEIFAEHPPLVAGEPARFVTHVTDLRTFEPRREGPIVFEMRQGSEASLSHTEQAPARPGIYLPSLTFPKEGIWTVTVSIPDSSGQSQIEWPVTVFANAQAVSNAAAPVEAIDSEGIAFLKEQQWQLGLRTEPVASRPLVERIFVPGQTRAKPGLSATVVAPLAGQIEAPPGAPPPEPGMQVKADQVLALLRPRFSDAAALFAASEAEFGRAEAELKQADAAFERIQKLAAAQARSQRELQEAEAALASSRARFSAAQALRSTYAAAPQTNAAAASTPVLELRAPIAGVLTAVGGGAGEMVAADQGIFSVLDARLLWIEGRATESAMARLAQPAQALCEVLDGSGRSFIISGTAGRLLLAGLQVDEATRTIPLLYEFNNEQLGLRAGQSVRLHVESSRAIESLALPYSALVEEGGLFVAYVHAAGERFVRRELRLGIRDGEWVQVLAGLSAGERVVTQGAYLVRLAASAGAIPAHGHEH